MWTSFVCVEVLRPSQPNGVIRGQAETGTGDPWIYNQLPYWLCYGVRLMSDQIKTRGPWATTFTWVNCCKLMRSFTHHSLSVCQVSRQWLKQFWDILLTRLKCWTFQRAILSQNKNIYGLWTGIWTFSKILCILWKELVGHAAGGTRGSMSLNAACHKEQQYIWFMGADQNSFRDITHFMKWRGWGIPRGTPLGSMVHVTKCASS